MNVLRVLSGGDGTDDFEQVVVDENGVGVIELTDGTRDVVEECTLARTTFEVVACEIIDFGSGTRSKTKLTCRAMVKTSPPRPPA